MIKNIKIFGERNSGTRFIRQLIKENIEIRVFNSCKDDYLDIGGWKHGQPKLELIKDIINDTLFVFIIRDLRKWLKSMYTKPYHLKRIKNEREFLLTKLKPEEKIKNHPVNIFSEESNLTIFRLRYNKIKSYLSMIDNLKNAIIINLEDTQVDKGQKFINSLEQMFKLKKKSLELVEIKNHTKCKTKIQNRIINVNLNDKIITEKENKNLEEFVNKLKNDYYTKISL